MPVEKKGASKPPISPHKYTSFVDNLHLRSVRLVALHADLAYWSKDDYPLAFSIDFHADLQDGIDEVVFLVKYTIVIEQPDSELDEMAKIVAEYAVICEADGKPPEGFLEVFAPMNLSRLVYPFFREVVAGITAKMELPTLFVPLNIFGGKRQKPKGKKGE